MIENINSEKESLTKKGKSTPDIVNEKHDCEPCEGTKDKRWQMTTTFHSDQHQKARAQICRESLTDILFQREWL